MRLCVTDQHHPLKGLGKRKNEAGFTIVEVLMAISIFAIGLLAVASMQYSAINVNTSANHQTIRTTYAMDRLEKLMALPYDDDLLKDNETAGHAASQALATTRTDTSIPGVTVEWIVNDIVAEPGTKLITVRVFEGTKKTVLTTRKSKI